MEKGAGLSSTYANFMHLGVVVRDMDETIRHLSSLGVCSFKQFTPGEAKILLRGKPAGGKLKICFAKIGQVELELIQPVSGESAHREFLESKGEGIQHIGFRVGDLDKELAELASQGVEVLTSGRWPGGGFAYLQTDAVGGIVIELFQG